MRWGRKPCPQCGADLHCDCAAIALVCLKCGYREAPPKPAGSRARPRAEQPLPSRSRAARRTPVAPRIALVEVRLGSRRLLEGVCGARGCQVVCFPSALCSAEEVALAGAGLFIVEADRGGLAVALARRLRAQAPAVPIAVVLTSWSESELEARSAAEFVMHAPLREIEVNGVLETMESYSGWLPSPLLAARYRDRMAS